MSQLPIRQSEKIKLNSFRRSSMRPTTSGGERSARTVHVSFGPPNNYSLEKFGVIECRVKSPETVAEELDSLRKRNSLLSAENAQLHGRCRQLQEMIERKAKELAMFNDPSESSKLLRNLGDNRPQTVRAFKQLHQKIFRLEARLLEKESDYNRIITDLKFTRVEELRAQLDTAIEEVHRLRELLHTRPETLSEWNKSPRGKRKSLHEKELEAKTVAMSKVIRSMEEDRQMLTAKNHYLLCRIRQLLRNDDFPPEDIEREIRNLDRPPKRESLVPAEEPHLIATLIESKPHALQRRKSEPKAEIVRIGIPCTGDGSFEKTRSTGDSKPNGQSSSRQSTFEDDDELTTKMKESVSNRNCNQEDYADMTSVVEVLSNVSLETSSNSVPVRESVLDREASSPIKSEASAVKQSKTESSAGDEVEQPFEEVVSEESDEVETFQTE